MTLKADVVRAREHAVLPLAVGAGELSQLPGGNPSCRFSRFF
jgi:hypothetical protein